MAAGSILGLLAWFSSAGAEAEEQAKADVVLRNGKIYTRQKRSIKQAIAFRGNTIVAVGSDAIPSSARSTAPNAALPA
jgi:coenzyme F420-reducing hydrogenase gamma subunit